MCCCGRRSAWAPACWPAFALSEWVGEVNRGRVRRVARRLREPGPHPHHHRGLRPRRRRSHSGGAAAGGLPIEARPGEPRRGGAARLGAQPGIARTAAGRTALAVPGIESVINSLLVRGEDDRASPDEPRATDQSA